MISEMTRERFYPWVVSLAAGVIGWFYVTPGIYTTAIEKLVDPVLTISTIAMGFLLTVTTVLMSLEDRTVVQELRRIGAYGTLLGYLQTSMSVWFIVAVLSVVVVLIDQKAVVPVIGYAWQRLGFIVWATLLVLGFLTSYRLARIMFALLRGAPRRPAAPAQNATERSVRTRVPPAV